MYQNEDQIGEVFEKAFRNGLVKREELHITSKVWNDMHGKGDVLLSLAKTLKDFKAGLCGYLFSPLAISELSRAGV